jgi:hypothetical protein
MSNLISNYLLRDLPRPRYLSGRKITRYLRTFCEILDGVAQDAQDARTELSIVDCSTEALAPHARSRNDRTFTRETFAALRLYLLRILAEKRKAGTTDAIRAQFARFGCPTVEIVTELDLRDAGVVGGFGGNIGFWFLVIRQPHPFPTFTTEWDGGGEWADEISYWGSAIGQTEIADMADIFRRGKPASTSCRFVIIDEDGTFTWGPGGLAGNYQLIPFNEGWEYVPPYGAPVHYYNHDFLVP